MDKYLRYRHRLFEYHLWILVPLVIALMIFLIIFINSQQAILILSLIGSTLSLIYFLQRQRLEELRTFRLVFSEFNSRYDEMNEDLNDLIEGKLDDDKDLSAVLYDYFNLCGEEYLYYRKGIIYLEVWKEWANGILYFLSHPRIKPIWMRDKENNNYYGLTLDHLTKITNRGIEEYKYPSSA